MKAQLIKGANLNPNQVKQVKAAFGYRWTIENEARARNWSHNSTPTIALETDENWIASHAFYFRRDGQLASKPAHCEPAYLAD